MEKYEARDMAVLKAVKAACEAIEASARAVKATEDVLKFSMVKKPTPRPGRPRKWVQFRKIKDNSGHRKGSHCEQFLAALNSEWRPLDQLQENFDFYVPSVARILIQEGVVEGR